MATQAPQFLSSAQTKRTQLREQCDTARQMCRIAKSQWREAKDMTASAEKMLAAAKIIHAKILHANMRALAAA